MMSLAGQNESKRHQCVFKLHIYLETTKYVYIVSLYVIDIFWNCIEKMFSYVSMHNVIGSLISKNALVILSITQALVSVTYI